MEPQENGKTNIVITTADGDVTYTVAPALDIHCKSQ